MPEGLECGYCGARKGFGAFSMFRHIEKSHPDILRELFRIWPDETEWGCDTFMCGKFYISAGVRGGKGAYVPGGVDLLDILPVPGDRVKCGNRTDLPKRERRHLWQDAGTDTRALQGFADCNIQICAACGADRAKKESATLHSDREEI